MTHQFPSKVCHLVLLVTNTFMRPPSSFLSFFLYPSIHWRSVWVSDWQGYRVMLRINLSRWDVLTRLWMNVWRVLCVCVLWALCWAQSKDLITLRKKALQPQNDGCKGIRVIIIYICFLWQPHSFTLTFLRQAHVSNNINSIPSTKVNSTAELFKGALSCDGHGLTLIRMDAASHKRFQLPLQKHPIDVYTIKEKKIFVNCK